MAAAAGAFGFIVNQDARLVQELRANVVDEQRDGDDALARHDVPSALAFYSKAVADAEHAVRLDPSNPRWMLNLASARAFLGYTYLKRNGQGDAARSHAEFLAAQAVADKVGKLDAKTPDVSSARVELQRELAAFLKS